MSLVSMLQSAKHRLRNMLTGSQAWTVHEANIAIFEALSTRKHPIPNEIILQILDYPSRWIRTTIIHARVASDKPFIRVGCNLQNQGEQQILATNPLSQLEAQQIRSVVFVFTSRDQGWSSYPHQHRTYDGSCTWLECGLIDSGTDGSEAPDGIQGIPVKASTRHELQRNRQWVFPIAL